MTHETLSKNNGIYITNIQDGFEQYHHEILQFSFMEAKSYFTNLCDSYNYQGIYADFYFYQLDDAGKHRVLESLSPSEQAYLFSKDSTQLQDSSNLIFVLDEILLSIVLKLNANELLFSTIYDTHLPATYWGNYNHQYIRFTQKEAL